MAVTHDYNGARIPDPIEQGEARAERWAERIRPNGEYECSCGQVVPIDDCETLSPDPYAEPFCFRCCEAACENRER